MTQSCGSSTCILAAFGLDRLPASSSTEITSRHQEMALEKAVAVNSCLFHGHVARQSTGPVHVADHLTCSKKIIWLPVPKLQPLTSKTDADQHI